MIQQDTNKKAQAIEVIYLDYLKKMVELQKAQDHIINEFTQKLGTEKIKSRRAQVEEV